MEEKIGKADPTPCGIHSREERHLATVNGIILTYAGSLENTCIMKKKYP